MRGQHSDARNALQQLGPRIGFEKLFDLGRGLIGFLIQKVNRSEIGIQGIAINRPEFKLIEKLPPGGTEQVAETMLNAQFVNQGVNAILEAWLPGEEGGLAVAETLFGDFNPGGKLPITFPRHVGQVPVFYNCKPSGSRSHWFTDYVSEKVSPLYPFGHGLSYTSFDYTGLVIDRAQAGAGGNVDVSFKISNCGAAAGDEVVQLYVHDEIAVSPRPVKELNGFARISLKPGETRRVTFHLPVDSLAFYDEELKLTLEPGRIEVMVGGSSEDIRLRGEFEIIGPRKILVKERVFVTPVQVELPA